MIEKLKSHLSNKKGFTLIELLIVIAIIAILVLIVVVAINPAQRLRDASNRTAASNVRSAGTLISTCVTLKNGDLLLCGSDTDVASGGEGNWPKDVVYSKNVISGTEDICAEQEGGDKWYIYRFKTGEVKENTATEAC